MNIIFYRKFWIFGWRKCVMFRKSSKENSLVNANFSLFTYFKNNLLICAGLALTNILTTQSNPVLERFRAIMVNILETLNDITKAEDNGVLTDSLIFIEGQTPSCFKDELLLKTYCETEHEQRKKQLMLCDPVHTIVLKDYLQMQVSGFCFYKASKSHCYY